MATGFRLTAESGGGILDHTMSDHLFFNGTRARYCATAQDTTGSDWALWDNDGADPAAGAEGGWSHEVDDVGPSDIYVDTRDTASIINYWDADRDTLHTLSFDHATERYQEWSYNGTGADDWTHDVTNENPGINTNANDGNCCLIVDADGDPWIIYHDISDLKLKAIVRSGGSWGTPVVIEATASTTGIGTLRVDGMRWLDDDGAAGIFVCYSYGVSGGSKNRMAYRKHSDALTASWTTEDIETSASIDNHISCQSIELGSDTKSTICMIAKLGSGNVIDFHKRSIGSPGTWAKTSSIRTDTTRPQLCIDLTNEEVYLLCGLTVAGSSTRVIYRKSAIGTISFGSDVTVLEDDGVTTFNDNISVPNHPVDSAMDMYVLGHNSGNIWWNRVTIAAPAPGGPPSQFALLGVG